MSNPATDGSGAVADLLACRTLLSAFPSVLTGIITHLPTRALSLSDGPGRWTPQQVLAHLLQIEEASWIPRIDHLLRGLDGPLPLVQPDRHLDRYASRDTHELLEAFSFQRQASLQAWDARQVGVEDWRRCARHPEAGTVTLGNIIGTWAMHDLDHLVQILAVVGHDGQRLVGPLARYLRICRGTRHV